MKEMICRLCLQTISNNNYCKPVEFLLKSLKLNQNISKENVMCIECANCLRVFSNFTPTSACKEEGTLPLSHLDDVIKLEPEATTNLKSFIKTEIKCSFCAQAHGTEDLISVKENKVFVDMLERYISEMNLKNTKELLTCETCLEALQGVILKWLKAEEKINKYIELEGLDDKGRVKLKKVQQFMFAQMIKSEVDVFGIDKLEDKSDRVREEYTVMTEAKIKYKEEISNTDLIIKTEDDDIETERDDCAITDIKSEQSGFQEFFIEYRNPSEIKKLQCEFCSYQTKRKYCLTRHLLIHKNPSDIKMFKCEFCSYQAKWRNYLASHLLTHKNPQEIKMFKCEICSYKTKQKSNLKDHLLTHKSPSEIQMFKCKICLYQTKRKSDLTSHLLIHKNPSEINMFKCEICSYETKYKCALIPHLLTHN